MFALEFTVRRGSGLLSKSQSLTIDTIQVADAFRVAPVDVEGVTVDAGGDEKASVKVVFAGEDFHTDVIGDATDALRANTTGGDVDPHDVMIHTNPTPDDPIRDREITADWR